MDNAGSVTAVTRADETLFLTFRLHHILFPVHSWTTSPTIGHITMSGWATTLWTIHQNRFRRGARIGLISERTRRAQARACFAEPFGAALLDQPFRHATARVIRLDDHPALTNELVEKLVFGHGLPPCSRHGP